MKKCKSLRSPLFRGDSAAAAAAATGRVLFSDGLIFCCCLQSGRDSDTRVANVFEFLGEANPFSHNVHSTIFV